MLSTHQRHILFFKYIFKIIIPLYFSTLHEKKHKKHFSVAVNISLTTCFCIVGSLSDHAGASYGVLMDRMTLLGLSFGTSVALSLAAYSSVIEVI